MLKKVVAGLMAAVWQVRGASVACVPFDAVRSSSKIDSGFNGKVGSARRAGPYDSRAGCSP